MADRNDPPQQINPPRILLTPYAMTTAELIHELSTEYQQNVSTLENMTQEEMSRLLEQLRARRFPPPPLPPALPAPPARPNRDNLNRRFPIDMLRVELIDELSTVYGQDREQLRNYTHQQLINQLEQFRGYNGGRKRKSRQRKSKQRKLNKRHSFRN